MRQLSTYTNNYHVYTLHVRDDNTCTLAASGVVTHILEDLDGAVVHGDIHSNDNTISIITLDRKGTHRIHQYCTDLAKENATKINVRQNKTQVLDFQTGSASNISVDSVIGGDGFCYLNVTAGTNILGRIVDKHKCVYVLDSSCKSTDTITVQKMSPWVTEVYTAAGVYAIGKAGDVLIMSIMNKNGTILNRLSEYTRDLDNIDVTTASMFSSGGVTVMLGGVNKTSNALSCVVAAIHTTDKFHTIRCGKVLDTGYKADGVYTVRHVGGYVMAVVYKDSPLSYVRIDTYINGESWMYTSPRLTAKPNARSLLSIPNMELIRD